MSPLRVLIIDDQHDTRRFLQDALATLDPAIETFAVPSGEEALLEVTQRKAELLIVDLRLPGISGQEMIRKVKQSNPQMKVIIVSGLDNIDLKRIAVEVEAEDFFSKPIDLERFLSSVGRCLDLPEEVLASSGEEDEPVENIPEQLRLLRHKLEAISVLLLDERGRVLARAGELPDDEFEMSFITPVMATLSASAKISSSLGKRTPSGIVYIAGKDQDILITHIGVSYALLISIPALVGKNAFSDSYVMIARVVKDIQLSLASLGVPLEPDDSVMVEENLPEEDEPAEGPSPLPDSIFPEEGVQSLDIKEADEFWKTAADEESVPGIQNADFLSYDQAAKLGLAPDDEG
jgi:FixJ family two-component response regulator